MRSTGAVSSAQLRELEADIREELARVERSLAREEQSAMLATTASSHAGSAVSADAGLASTLTGMVQARHAELTEALRRIEDSRYGVCDNCGEAIPYGRLLVVPEATNCLRCR